ncbi:2Fe-2S iron-sulfur cluster-binding protein [Thalassotalea fonticola]|uniref:2Fe-2S iron-sulfur cluster-binding protein n=1 Tax=Thalassotalea fonticola TaxID=3065649 RepID=A0ABZ0GLX2_9GAMM|nr:2Fe-2S iron-sulfur cluster-binding protein [Colwelliaceae bacterium S1-1]
MSTDFYPLTIASVEHLTEEAIQVRFNFPAELTTKFYYKQGQHLTLKAIIDGVEVRRSYSVCSGVHEQKLVIAIKCINNGIFSNYAFANFTPGMILEVMPPQGHFRSELSIDNENNYLLIAVGSGITPIISHIQSILAAEPQAKVTLIYGNKSAESVMFYKTLSVIHHYHKDRFQWLNIFSQQQQSIALYNGRINQQKLLDLAAAKVIDLAVVSDVFLCGPEIMIDELSNAFKAWQLDQHHIYSELFFSQQNSREIADANIKREQQYHNETSAVSVKIDGVKTIYEIPKAGDSIVDSAMAQGADLPYSCKAGVCATCMAKLIKGKVEMDEDHVLTDEELAQGMILACQSHPQTDEVEINFDL